MNERVVPRTRKPVGTKEAAEKNVQPSVPTPDFGRLPRGKQGGRKEFPKLSHHLPEALLSRFFCLNSQYSIEKFL